MAELSTVARPYAKAAFQYADQHGLLSQWSEMFKFAAAVVENQDFSSYLKNPSTSSDQQAAALIDVASEKFDKPCQNFIHVLAEKNRLPALPQILTLFEELKSQKEKSVDVLVTSAFALSESQKSLIADGLKKKLNREVNLTSEEDKSLIGGVIIRAGDLVLDSSVKGKLAKLSEKLNS